MTVNDRDALDALRRRLSHAEAICGLLTENDTTELGEAIRGVRLLVEDGVCALDHIIAANAKRTEPS